MKKLYILLIALFIANGTMAQGCLPEGINFTTQAQVDNFQFNYPGCTEIEGDVNFQSDYSVSNLNGLSVLTSIGGDLTVHFNWSLSSLAGLENLASVGGDLVISKNDSLTSLTGLEHLTFIGGSLQIGTAN